jgi:hypothetical protein
VNVDETTPNWAASIGIHCGKAEFVSAFFLLVLLWSSTACFIRLNALEDAGLIDFFWHVITSLGAFNSARW